MVHRFKPMMLLLFVAPLAFSQGEMKLSLEQALKTSLERNLDIQLERLNVDTRKLDIDSTRTRFEPKVSSTLSSTESKSSASNSNEGSAGATITDSSSTLSADLSKSEWWGFSWSLSSDNRLSDRSAANSFGQSYGSSLNLGFRQELLKGFSLDKEVMLNDRYLAIANSTSARIDLENRLTTTLQNTENAYWELVLAREQLEVNKASLDLAQKFLEQNKTKVQVGTLPPIDLITAETRVAGSEREIVTAENNVQAAEDTLKKFMNLPVEQWSQHIIPTDRIQIETLTTDFTQDLETALANRPEMLKDDQSLRLALLELKLKDNDLLPSLTFSGQYGYSGVSQSRDILTTVVDPATGLPVINPNTGQPYSTSVGFTDTSWRDSLSDLLEQDKPSWSASLQMTWYPFNKAAKVNRTKAEVALRQQELRHEQTRVTIVEDVRSAVRQIQANLKGIQASEKSVKFSRENLKATEQKFQNGLSTNYEVAEKQKDLVQDETNLIQTKISYVKAVTNYYRALGKLLDKRNIVVQ